MRLDDTMIAVAADTLRSGQVVQLLCRPGAGGGGGWRETSARARRPLRHGNLRPGDSSWMHQKEIRTIHHTIIFHVVTHICVNIYECLNTSYREYLRNIDVAHINPPKVFLYGLPARAKDPHCEAPLTLTVEARGEHQRFSWSIKGPGTAQRLSAKPSARFSAPSSPVRGRSRR